MPIEYRLPKNEDTQREPLSSEDDTTYISTLDEWHYDVSWNAQGACSICGGSAIKETKSAPDKNGWYTVTQEWMHNPEGIVCHECQDSILEETKGRG